MSDLVQIEYHPTCTFYGDEGCIEQTGEYVCACGASTAWHKTTPVEIDYEAAKTCESCEGSGVMLEPHDFGVVEQLSCSDCRGGQWINDEAVKWVLSQALGIEGGDDDDE